MKIQNLITGAILLLLLFGCKKDDEEITTYQIVNNVEGEVFKKLANLDDPDIDGSMWEVLVLCYDKPGRLLDIDTLDPVRTDGGMTAKIEVHPDCARVKPSFKFIPPQSKYYYDVKRYYLLDFTELKKGENTKIIINNYTYISEKLTNFDVTEPENKIQLQFDFDELMSQLNLNPGFSAPEQKAVSSQ